MDLPILGLIDGFWFFSRRETGSDDARERAGAARIREHQACELTLFPRKFWLAESESVTLGRNL
jgi:hypothetical protein